MEDRQGVEEDVGLGEAPFASQHLGVGDQVGVGQHGALGPARGPGRVEDGGEVVRAARHLGEGRRRSRGLVGQGPLPPGVEGLHLGPAGEGGHPFGGGGRTDDHRRLGVANEIVELRQGVAGVERQVDRPGAQAAQVKEHRHRALLHLHRHPVARTHAQPRQGVGVAAGALDHLAIAEAQPLRGGQERPVCPPGGAGRRQGEKVVGHGVFEWLKGSRTMPSRASAVTRKRRVAEPERRE